MSRAHNGKISRNRHKKVLKLAKGYRGRGKNCFRVAVQRVEKGLQYAYRDRRVKKREFRKLWIARINAACRQHGMNYSTFINELQQHEIQLNRKVLADLAMNHPQSFQAIIEKIK